MFADRLMQCCAQKGVRQKDIATILDTTPSVITGWKNGASPNSQFVIALAKYFSVSTDYLLGLSDDPRPSSEQQSLDEREAALISKIRKVDEPSRTAIFKIAEATIVEFDPTRSSFLSQNDSKTNHAKVRQIADRRQAIRRKGQRRKRVEGLAAAGAPITTVRIDGLMVTVPTEYMGEEYFIVQASDSSMIDVGINDGDYCVFNREAHRDSGRIMYVQIESVTEEPEGTIKRVFFNENQVELRSENPAYEPMFYPINEVTLNGVLTAVLSPEAEDDDDE